MAVTKEGLMKRKNGTGNPGDECRFIRAFTAVAVLVRLMFVLVQGEQFC